MAWIAGLGVGERLPGGTGAIGRQRLRHGRIRSRRSRIARGRHHIGDGDGHGVRGCIAAGIGDGVRKAVSSHIVGGGHVGVAAVGAHGDAAVGRIAGLGVGERLPGGTGPVGRERLRHRRVGVGQSRVACRRHYVGDRDGHRVGAAVAAGVGDGVAEAVESDIVGGGRVGVDPFARAR